MKNERRLILALGVLLGLLFVWGVSLGLARRSPKHHHKVRCLPYFLIPRELVCGKRVVYVNPDGSRVSPGLLKDLHPMPKPPPDKR